MALETAVFQQDPFSYGYKDFHSLGGVGDLGYGFGPEEEMVSTETLGKNTDQKNFNGYWETPPSFMLQSVKKQGETGSSSPELCTGADGLFSCRYAPSNSTIPVPPEPTSGQGPRKRRRRTKNSKNKQELESQRMTHIAVERNRRRQMNDYLAVLRSLMPPSYAQRGDQASIVGGAINFVKELEQLLQFLEAHKQVKLQQPHAATSTHSSLFANFFTFPQFSTPSTRPRCSATAGDPMAEKPSAVADIQVSMVESHATLKVLSARRPKQLLHMVAGLESAGLTILHLNVTTADHMVLYSFSLKIEDDCQLTTVNDIASTVHDMVCEIQKEMPCGVENPQTLV